MGLTEDPDQARVRSPIIGVMGPGELATPQIQTCAYELGRQIARAGWILLTGGRKAGVMDAASWGAKSAGGLTLGILPDADLDPDQVSEAVDVPILTGLGHGRNMINILSSQGVIACGLGPGTTSEIALALKTGKPLVLLQIDPDAHQFFQSLTPTPLSLAQTPGEAITIIKSLLFP